MATQPVDNYRQTRGAMRARKRSEVKFSNTNYLHH
jgi:hypothetical protein